MLLQMVMKLLGPIPCVCVCVLRIDRGNCLSAIVHNSKGLCDMVSAPKDSKCGPTGLYLVLVLKGNCQLVWL